MTPQYTQLREAAERATLGVAILSLIADVEEMLRALEPFARHYDLNDLAERDEDDALEIPVGDLRRASATLNKRSRQMTECERMTKEEFTARFKARMLAIAGEKFADGDSIAEYADMTAPTYWGEPSQREEGPEECADADMSYWGDE